MIDIMSNLVSINTAAASTGATLTFRTPADTPPKQLYKQDVQTYGGSGGLRRCHRELQTSPFMRRFLRGYHVDVGLRADVLVKLYPRGLRKTYQSRPHRHLFNLRILLAFAMITSPTRDV